MRRELPIHPHIDHLKKQAKDLLDAHKRGDSEALERIVASLPAFARLAASEAAGKPFALHDAQSTIAREYGFASWNDLREEVDHRASRAVPDAVLRALAGQPLPPEVTAALSEAWDGRGASEPALPAAQTSLPLVAFRGALLTPGAIAPIHVARASSMAAVAAAVATDPPLIAVITQRDGAIEEPGFEDLHAVGCIARVKKRVDAAAGVFIVIEGLWWARLEGLESPGARPYATVAVRAFEVGGDMVEAERDTLVASLRERAHRLAQAMPNPERVTALVDSIRVPARLSDLIVANLPCAVDDKARYAAEPTLRDRLRSAIALCDAQLAGAPR